MRQVTERELSGSRRTIKLVDGDVHSTIMPSSLHARLSSHWQRHLEELGPRVAGAYAMFPRMRNGGFRIDARPETGFPGSDLGLVQQQLLADAPHARAAVDRGQPPLPCTRCVQLQLHGHTTGAAISACD